METNKKVSIVIASYNRKNYLLEVVESLLQQTYSAIEVVIVDDGSTDGTEKLFLEGAPLFDGRVLYFQLPQNKGASYARNFGIARVTGDYTFVWDSDDVLYPYAVERVMSIFNKHTEVGTVSAPARALLGKKEVAYPVVQDGYVSFSDIVCKQLPGNDKVRISKSNLFKKAFYYSKNIDFLVNVQLAEQAPWYHISEYLGEIRLQSDANSLTKQRKKPNVALSIERSRYLKEFLDKHASIIKQDSPALYAAHVYGMSMGLILDGHKDVAQAYLLDAFQTYPRNIRNVGLLCVVILPFSSKIMNYLFKRKI